MAKEEFSLIPTSLRVRMSKELSFPLGAEVISRALHGVPGYEGLQLSFSGYLDRANPSRVREAVQDSEPLTVLEVWGASSITVYPVPRENKSVVRQALCEEGLPRLRLWLEEYAKWVEEIPDRFRQRSCALSVCMADATLHVSEREFQLPQWTERRRP